MALLMLLAFTLTLFFSATLLFLVQPMVGKLLLPQLGGTPAVWNTCMVFFQALLLAGYTYAHVLSRRLSMGKQLAVHAVVLVLPLLPLLLLRFDVGRVAAALPPPAEANPTGWLLAVLLVVAGLPFFVVSATAPLLQKWFAGTDHPSARDPYFLYAASNVGSMLALLGYPTVVERQIGVREQAVLWALAYTGLAALIVVCGLIAARRPGKVVELAPADGGADGAPPLARKLRWVLLAAVPSSVMLGVTTHVTTDIAAIPLLWVLPLALYLLSFILVFSRPWLKDSFAWLAVVGLALALGALARSRLPDVTANNYAEEWQRWKWVFGGAGLYLAGVVVLMALAAARRIDVLHLAMLLLAPAFILAVAFDWDLRKSLYVLRDYQVILLHLAALFAVAMVCHGELARTRPPTAHLTGFYLLMSLGGVLGGLFNALVAPVAFDRVVEYPLALALALVLLPRFTTAEHPARLRRLDAALAGLLVAFGAVMGLAFVGRSYVSARQARAAVEQLPERLRGPASWAVRLATDDGIRPIYRERNFFGCFTVNEYEYAAGTYHYMYHGTTTHGVQIVSPVERRREALSYFHPQGPIGQLFEAVQARGTPQRVCVLGVGTGTLGAYAEPGWDLTLYEIDPAVVRVAMNREFFTFLPDCQARGVNVRVDLGDGRKQIEKAPDGAYDLIFMDAFTSDAVPVHLLSREAIETYLKKLAPGGLIVVNISNRYLDFQPVLGNLAQSLGLCGRVGHGYENRAVDMYACSWVVLARDEAALGKLRDFKRDDGSPAWVPLPVRPEIGVWTDDYSNLLAVFQW